MVSQSTIGISISLFKMSMNKHYSYGNSNQDNIFIIELNLKNIRYNINSSITTLILGYLVSMILKTHK